MALWKENYLKRQSLNVANYLWFIAFKSRVVTYLKVTVIAVGIGGANLRGHLRRSGLIITVFFQE